MALRVIIFISLVLVWQPVAAQCQDAVKQSVFEDCERAEKEFDALTPEQKLALLDFLTRVVGLNTQLSAGPESFVFAPQRPGDSSLAGAPKGAEVLPGSLWQSMDAKREVRAKRCALTLLERAGSIALDTLPTLTRLYSDSPLSDEVAVALEETAATIAERAHRQGMNPSQQQFEALFPYLLSQRPLVAQNIVEEYLVFGAPHLISFLAGRSEAEIQSLAPYVHAIDKDGSRTMRTVLDLVPSLSPQQIALLVRALPVPSRDVLSQFIGEYVKLSSTIQNGQTFLPLLAEACVRLEGFKVDSLTEAHIALIPNILLTGDLSDVHAACLVGASPRLARKLVETLTPSQSVAQIEHSLAIVKLSYSSINPEARQLLWPRVKELSNHPSVRISNLALQSAALFTEFRNEQISLAQQSLKRGFDLKEAADRDAIVSSSLDVLYSARLAKDCSRFIPTIIRALRGGTAREAAVRLSSQCSTIEPELLTLVRGSQSEAVQRSALEALSSLPSLTKAALPAILESIPHEQLQGAAERALRRLGASGAPSIRRSLPKVGVKTRGVLLSVLATTGSATRSELAELASSLPTTDCGFGAEHSSAFCAIARIQEITDTTRSQLVQNLDRCIPTFAPDAVREITVCAPDIVRRATQGVVGLLSEDRPSETIKAIIELMFSSPSSTKESESLILALLDSAAPSARLALLSRLSGEVALSTLIKEKLRAIISSSSKGSPTFFAASEILANSGDATDDWRPFVKDSIRMMGHNEYTREVRAVLSKLSPAMVLPEVSSALDSDDPDTLVGGVLVGACLGPRAIPIVSKVWHLREHRLPSVRYAATLALLEINPLTPELSHFVERILVNRYFPLAAGIPIKWAQTVAVVDLNKASFGSLRTVRLEGLLSAPW